METSKQDGFVDRFLRNYESTATFLERIYMVGFFIGFIFVCNGVSTNSIFKVFEQILTEETGKDIATGIYNVSIGYIVIGSTLVVLSIIGFIYSKFYSYA